MSKKFSPSVFFVNFGFTVFVILYLLLIAPYSVIGKFIVGISVLFAIAQIRFFWSDSDKHRQWYLYLVMFNFLYLCVEILAYAMFTLGLVRADAQYFANALEANSKGWAKYDSVVGYRAIPGEFRNVKYVDNTLVYDHISTINNQGWFSTQDYLLPKREGVKRYAVLGDSFTAGFNIAETWPDLVGRKMGAIELYNFSLEGIGIQNWYLIYFNEVLKYDFDGLIVAISNEQFGVSDMDRKLMIMHSEDKATYIGVFDSLPTPDEFYNNKQRLNKGYSIIGPERLNQALCGYQKECSVGPVFIKPDLYFLHTIIELFAQMKSYFKMEAEYAAYTKSLADRYPDGELIKNIDEYRKKYPYVSLLEKIASHALQNGKELLLVGIPDFSGTTNSNIAERNEAEMTVLASSLNASYFNGYSCFYDMQEEEIKKHYYQNDLHWNQKGVYLFSDVFSDWLATQNGFE